MARYRIEFSRDWIRGRWGFIDRMFYKLGGKETEPSRLENAWLVEFNGNPRALGTYLAERLEIQEKDFAQFGTIFEISEVAAPIAQSPPAPSGGAAPKRLGTPKQ